MTSSRTLPLLWDVERLRLPVWNGEKKGVFQTVGGTVAQDFEAKLALHVVLDTDIPIGKVFVPEVWESDIPGPTAAWFQRGSVSIRAAFHHEDALLLNFDLVKTVEAMLFERYRREKRPLATRLPIPYQWFVPRCLRTPIKQIATLFFGGKLDRFPMWPWEIGLLTLMELCLPRLSTDKWPKHRRLALALSHDVESLEGVKLAEDVARLEADYDVKSTWFIVGKFASAAAKLCNRVKAMGHEIGLHGTHHDMAFPFLTRSEMEKRLDGCQSFMDDYGVRGFRSPALLRTDLMYEVLGERFAYDSSVVDSGRLSPHARPTGCASIFPFRRGRLVVAPITLPMDASLIFIGLDHEQMLALWADKLGFIAEYGAAAVFTSHTEPHFFGNKEGLATYERFLKSVTKRKSIWLATLGQMVDHAAAQSREEAS